MVGYFVEPGEHCARSSRNEAADDDVLLQPFQSIRFAVHGGIGEHPGGLLERSRRDEGLGLEAGLGDAKQHRLTFRLLLASGFRRSIGVVEVETVHLLALEELGIARIVNFRLLQHLPDDDLDMLVIDRHALEAIDLLDLVDEIVGKLLDALNGQDVMRRRVTVEQILALLDGVAFLHRKMPSLGNQEFHGILGFVIRGDDDAPLILVVAAKLHRSRNFSDDGVVLRTPRLEQFGNAGQTTRDIAGLGALHGNTRQNVAALHFAARLDREHSIDRKQITRFRASAELADLALLVLDYHRRPKIGAARRSAPVDDHAVGDARRLVALLADRHALDQILELDGARDLREHRTGVRIPLGETITALDLSALVDPQMRAVRQPMHGELGAIIIDNHDGGVAAHDHVPALGVLNDVALLDLHSAFKVRLERGLIDNLGTRHAAQMERAHSELGTRLTDRLSRDDTDRFTHIDGRTAGKIAPVAFAANTAAGLASQCRSDANLLNARVLNLLDMLLFHQLTGLDDDLAGCRVLHGLGRRTAEHALAKRHSHFARIEHRTGHYSAIGTAIHFSNDTILCHVDETPREVTGVRCLQRRICQTLTGTMGGVEVLHHRQPLLEVGEDRRLDDLARRLGHQTAHAGKLLHLGGRTTRTRMRHHIDRVDGLYAPGLLVLLDRGNAFHHLLSD